MNYDYLDDTAEQILIQLAKRKCPETNRWNKLDSKFSHAYTIHCLICDQTFPNVQGINRHGIQHLKDKNLLPFI